VSQDAPHRAQARIPDGDGDGGGGCSGGSRRGVCQCGDDQSDAVMAAVTPVVAHPRMVWCWRSLMGASLRKRDSLRSGRRGVGLCMKRASGSSAQGSQATNDRGRGKLFAHTMVGVSAQVPVANAGAVSCG
jgi:hypothetical protein